MEATSWRDKVFPAAKLATDLEICVLAAGLSSLLGSASRTPEPQQHPKEITKGHLGEQAVPQADGWALIRMDTHARKEAVVDGGVLNTIATRHVSPLITPVRGAGANRLPGASRTAVWQAVPHRNAGICRERTTGFQLSGQQLFPGKGICFCNSSRDSASCGGGVMPAIITKFATDLKK